MKRFLILIALIAGAAGSCQRFDTDITPARTSVSFNAHLEETRTVFGDKEGSLYPVLFTSQDEQVAVSLNLGTPVMAKVTPGADGRSATFRADFPATSGDCQFAVFSPAGALKDFAPAQGKVSVSIPAEQTPSATSCDPAAQLLAGFTTSVSGLPQQVGVTLSHLTAYAKVNFTGIPDLKGASIMSASITSQDFCLAGDADISLLTQGFSFPSGSHTVKAVTHSAENVWFGLAPCASGGTSFTFELETGAGSYRKTVTLPEGRDFASGKVASFNVDMSSAEFVAPDRKSISILAIGNSFSVDAMEYLYKILKQVGYENISLGNLYIGGCTLETHAGNLRSKGNYTYYTNNSDKWNSVSQNSIAAMKSQKWDYVSIQQGSPVSGRPASYEPYLSEIIDSVKVLCPGAKIMWHMTWAYQWNYTSTNFGNYGYNQDVMYSDIVSSVKEKVLSRDDIAFVIPSGTAIQNLRTSTYGDNWNRDGFHMHYGRGRLATAMMWAKSITGCSLQNISYSPASYPVDSEQLAAIKQAVEAAYEKPFEVTPFDPQYTPNTTLRNMVSQAGYNLDDYVELPWMATKKAYFNSTSGAAMFSAFNGRTDSNLANFVCTSSYFGKDDLPEGTLLVVKSGWQYRPEGWTNLRTSTSSSSRPANVSTPIVKVSSSWWGTWNYRAFNISKTAGGALSAAELADPHANFAIFVPKKAQVVQNPSCDEIVTLSGRDLSNYNKMTLSFTRSAYYYSNSNYLSNLVTDASNSPQFSATRIFTKSELPSGTLIVVTDGYQYRPEAWVDLSTKNEASVRPGNVSAPLTVVDINWWAGFNYRGFNLSKIGNSTALSSAEMQKMESSFAIYIPKK